MGFSDDRCLEQDLKQLVEEVCAFAEGELKAKAGSPCLTEIDELSKYLNKIFERLRPAGQRMRVISSQVRDGIEHISEVNQTLLEVTNRILNDIEKVLDNHHEITGPLEGLKAALAAGSSDKARMKQYLENIESLFHQNKKVLMGLLTALSFHDPACQKLRKAEGVLQEAQTHLGDAMIGLGVAARGNGVRRYQEKTAPTEKDESSLKSSAITQAEVDKMLKRSRF